MVNDLRRSLLSRLFALRVVVDAEPEPELVLVLEIERWLSAGAFVVVVVVIDAATPEEEEVFAEEAEELDSVRERKAVCWLLLVSCTGAIALCDDSAIFGSSWAGINGISIDPGACLSRRALRLLDYRLLAGACDSFAAADQTRTVDCDASTTGDHEPASMAPGNLRAYHTPETRSNRASDATASIPSR